MSVVKRQVDIAKDYIKSVVKYGDIVIDATAGNGNDTLFLASLVGDFGHVYSFDIQDIAIDTTKKLLRQNDYLHRVNLINDSHVNIKKYVDKNIKCAMFNLGYLPTGDHNIITKCESTILAINSSLQLLVSGGIVTIIIYYGHEGGMHEKNNVIDYISKIDSAQYSVQSIENINCRNTPPILIVIEKK